MANSPATADEYITDLARGLKLITERSPEYTKGRDYYDGRAKEITSNPTIQKVLEANAEAHPVSLANIPVDALFDKVELSGFTVTDDERANDVLAAILDENDLEEEADDWHRKAGYFGDYYAIIDPVEEDTNGNATKVKIVGSSPLSTAIIYSTKDGRTALYGVKRWQGAGKQWYANLFYDDATVSLATGPDIDNLNDDARQFFPLLDDEQGEGSEKTPHKGGKLLLVHYAIDGKPYGMPVHRKAWGPQDAITKISATNLATVDGQGFPTRWALLDPMAEVDDDIDDDFGTDGLAVTEGSTAVDDGMTTQTTGVSRLRSMPGTMQMLAGIKSVGQFDAATSDNFLKNIEFYIRIMAVACGVPLFEFDLNGEQPSGEARRRASGRLNKHARKIKRALAQSHKTLAETILATLGLEKVVEVTFLPTETETDKDGLELVALKIKTGIPVRAALLEAGYTTETIDEWYPKDEPHLTPELLQIIAEVLSKLGQAKTLGIITDQELADMLPTILTAARNEGPAIDTAAGAPVADPAAIDPEVVKAVADALGALVRGGADPASAASFLGITGVEFPNVPTTVRVPQGDAAALEGK
jgi:hypothetical protein